jgi:hypothetical protein
MEAFLINSLKSEKVNILAVSGRISRFFENIISSLLAGICSQKENHRFRLGPVCAVLQKCVFFLFHCQDLHYVLSLDRESGKINTKTALELIINHKSYPFEKLFELGSLILEFLNALLEERFSLQFKIRDDTVSSSRSNIRYR